MRCALIQVKDRRRHPLGAHRTAPHPLPPPRLNGPGTAPWCLPFCLFAWLRVQVPSSTFLHCTLALLLQRCRPVTACCHGLLVTSASCLALFRSLSGSPTPTHTPTRPYPRCQIPILSMSFPLSVWYSSSSLLLHRTVDACPLLHPPLPSVTTSPSSSSPPPPRGCAVQSPAPRGVTVLLCLLVLHVPFSLSLVFNLLHLHLRQVPTLLALAHRPGCEPKSYKAAMPRSSFLPGHSSSLHPCQSIHATFSIFQPFPCLVSFFCYHPVLTLLNSVNCSSSLLPCEDHIQRAPPPPLATGTIISTSLLSLIAKPTH